MICKWMIPSCAPYVVNCDKLAISLARVEKVAAHRRKEKKIVAEVVFARVIHHAIGKQIGSVNFGEKE